MASSTARRAKTVIVGFQLRLADTIAWCSTISCLP
jgi:hypothetical protein